MAKKESQDIFEVAFDEILKIAEEVSPTTAARMRFWVEAQRSVKYPYICLGFGEADDRFEIIGYGTPDFQLMLLRQAISVVEAHKAPADDQTH